MVKTCSHVHTDHGVVQGFDVLSDYELFEGRRVIVRRNIGRSAEAAAEEEEEKEEDQEDEEVEEDGGFAELMTWTGSLVVVLKAAAADKDAATAELA